MITVVLDHKHQLLRLTDPISGHTQDIIIDVREDGQMEVSVGTAVDKSGDDFPELCYEPVHIII